MSLVSLISFFSLISLMSLTTLIRHWFAPYGNPLQDSCTRSIFVVEISHFESINIDGKTDKILKNQFTLDNQSTVSTILIFGEIVTKIENDLRKVLKNITDINCEISTWDKKLVIRAIADDNYQLKNKIKYILENIIYDKIPKTWYL